ncbi:MAG: DUF4214 domain-containing protein [Methylococcales bacterium]|nr:DUF4214 domain-containing protein [Methylococcales bacterium]
MAITTEQKETIIELYSAYFNRAADAGGANFWINSFETYMANAPTTLLAPSPELYAFIEVLADISTATEYQQLYPSTLENSDFITKIYTNLLGRLPDAGGKDFWVNNLNEGKMTSGEAIIRIIEGAKANTEPQGLKDAALIANKTAISVYFVDYLKSNDGKLSASAFSNITADIASVESTKSVLNIALGVSFKQIVELYSAYFNRAADAGGVEFWEKSFETYRLSAADSLSDALKDQFALTAVSNDISTAAEYQALYPSALSSNDFITAIYTNLLGRAPDVSGRDFWVNQLDQGGMTKDEAIIRMIEGAKANTEPQGLKDAALIANKTEVSMYFVDPLQSNDVTLAKTALATLTADESTVVVAKAALDSALGMIHLSANNSLPQQGTEGIADFFIYDIDSSLFIVESSEVVDVTLQGFKVGEDKLVFDDVRGKTITTESFRQSASIESATDTRIIFEKAIVLNNNTVVSEPDVALTLAGVSDFSTVDFSIV